MAEFVASNTLPISLPLPLGSHLTELKPTFRCLDCGIIYKERKSLNDHICKDVTARPYVCEVCKKDFARQDRLTRHRRIHTGERPYGCGCCSETFARTERLKKHMKKAHGVSKLACCPCNITFDRWADFQKHIAGHPSSVGNAGGNSSRVEVKQETPVDRNFQGRYAGHNNDVKPEPCAFGNRTSCSYWCSMCGEGFIAEHIFQEHLKTHRNQYSMQERMVPPFYQPNINFPLMNDTRNIAQPNTNDNMQAFDFAVGQSLARRMSNGIDSGILRCMRCGKLLPFGLLPPTYADMESCQQMNEFCTCHLAAEREQQRILESAYTNGNWLSPPEEKKQKRLVSIERRTCYECGELLSSVYALVRHVQSKHCNDRPYVCCECDKAFTRRDKLGRHFLKHPGIFQYACTECGAMFPRWIDCRQHMRLHRLSCNLCHFPGSGAGKPNAEPHVHANTCHVCGAHFSRGYRLAEHIRKHTGEAPFACGRCGRGFAKLDHKIAHEKLHTRENSLICGTCRETFDSVEMLMQHRRTHLTTDLNNQPGSSVGSAASFTCDTCLRQFKKKYALQRHQLSHTGERPYPCPNCGLAFTTSYGRKRHIESVHAGIMVHPII